jgi:exoribonuclease R
MVAHRVSGAPLDFAALRTELGLPEVYPSDAAAVAAAVAAAPTMPDEDATDIPLVTVDPVGSRDLDQAVHLSRQDDGFLVVYAIADVASFVRPGGALDVETHRRGETMYFPDRRIPLHPPVLSEGAASLLPDQVSPAVVWRIRLDAQGEPTAVDVRRARVRSRAQLDYEGVQTAADARRLPEALAPLVEIGELRRQAARRRHAIDLDLPEQEVVDDGNHGWTLQLRRPLPVEQYNAEISLLTGMCAAQLMLQAGVGILRTIPAPGADAIAALQRAAAALGIAWPDGTPPGDVLDSIDRADPRQVVLLEHAASLLRGAAYTVFDGAPPALTTHSGIAAPYAHVTAPLRRLVDRYGTEICLAAHANSQVPQWVRDALPELPAQMQAADHLAHAADRAVVDATEAWLLRDRVGEVFTAVVLGTDDHSATIALDEPAVRAKCPGAGLVAGERVQVRLLEADVAQRRLRLEPVVQVSDPSSTVTAAPASRTR